jgi:hypothetical protein
VLLLVVCAAEKMAARGEALAAWQMNAAVVAAHHVFARSRWGTSPVHALAVALQYPVDQQYCKNEKNDF